METTQIKTKIKNLIITFHPETLGNTDLVQKIDNVLNSIGRLKKTKII